MESVPIPVLKSSAVESQVVASSPALNSDTYATLKEDERTGVPLNTAWTFWFDKATQGNTAAEYEANMRLIYTVNTVESFWSVYHHIPDVCEIALRYSYHLMRGGRRPMWEDDINKDGGTWRIKVSKKDVSRVWKELLLASIGEQFEGYLAPGDEVVGITVSVREREDLVQIWNADSSLAVEGTIMKKIRSLLPDVNFMGDFYKPHQTHHAYEGEKTEKVQRKKSTGNPF